MVVGMPFKDIATTDSIYLAEVPAIGSTAQRKVLISCSNIFPAARHYKEQHNLILSFFHIFMHSTSSRVKDTSIHLRILRRLLFFSLR